MVLSDQDLFRQYYRGKTGSNLSRAYVPDTADGKSYPPKGSFKFDSLAPELKDAIFSVMDLRTLLYSRYFSREWNSRARRQAFQTVRVVDKSQLSDSALWAMSSTSIEGLGWVPALSFTKILELEDKALIGGGNDAERQERLGSLLRSMPNIERVRINGANPIRTSSSILLPFALPISHISARLANRIEGIEDSLHKAPSKFRRQSATVMLAPNLLEADPAFLEHIISSIGKASDLRIALGIPHKIPMGTGGRTEDGLPMMKTIINSLAKLTVGVSAELTELYILSIIAWSDDGRHEVVRTRLTAGFRGDVRKEYSCKISGSLETSVRDRIKEENPEFTGRVDFKDQSAFLADIDPADVFMTEQGLSRMNNWMKPPLDDSRAPVQDFVNQDWTIWTRVPPSSDRTVSSSR